MELEGGDLVGDGWCGWYYWCDFGGGGNWFCWVGSVDL